MGERLRYIDYAKGIAIIFVVIGHLLPSATWLVKWIYTFHIPLFFIVSGMMQGRRTGKERGFFETVIKLVKTLLVPYAIFNAIELIVRYTAGLNAFSQSEFNQKIFLLCLGTGNATWFLVSLFIAQILFYLLQKIKKEYIKAVAVIFLLIFALVTEGKVLFLMAINRGFIGLSFIYIGYYISKKTREKDIDIRKWKLPVGIVLLLVNVIVAVINPFVDLYHFTFGNIVLYYIGSVTGTLFILFLCAKIEKLSIAPLEYMGKNSIITQCTHGLLKSIVAATLINGEGMVPEMLRTVIVLLLEFPVIYIITNYLGFIIGRKSKKRLIKRQLS